MPPPSLLGTPPGYHIHSSHNTNIVPPSSQVCTPPPLTAARANNSNLHRNTEARGGTPTNTSNEDNTATASQITVEHAALLQHCAKLQAQLQLTASTVMAEKETPYVKTAVTQHAKRELFKLIKFIVSDEQLDNTIKDDSVAMFMFRALQIGKDRRPSFWKRYRMVVFRAIVDQRSNVMDQIKKAWFGKYLFILAITTYHELY